VPAAQALSRPIDGERRKRRRRAGVPWEGSGRSPWLSGPPEGRLTPDLPGEENRGATPRSTRDQARRTWTGERDATPEARRSRRRPTLIGATL
jgi:hypothetical protein